MAAVIKMFAAVLMVVIPGGLLVMAAFILARVVAEKLKAAEGGPHRYKRALSGLKLRDVWNEARRSL